MTNKLYIDSVSVLKSLADETRLAIVRKLASDGCDVASGDIVKSCATFHELSQPAMSHHFQKLVLAGVLVEKKAGVEKRYELNSELLQNIGINPNRI